MDGAGVVSAASFVARDISDQKRADRELKTGRNELHRLAYTDSLTGLANRARLREVLDEKVCERDEGACLLVIDLDDFKAINDTVGHGVGDELLRSVADRLRGLVRAPDLVARLGGDEFAIVLLQGDLDHGGRVAQRVVDELSTPHIAGGGVYLATASVGVAIAASGTSREGLLRDADVAMYAAKRAGRSGWVMFDHTMRQATIERVDLEHDLRGAVEAGELILHLQPIVSVATGQVSSFEALVRWRHPIRGLVQPDGFIPLAEETGLIVDIGEWVLREACEQAKRLSGLAGRSVHVAVNVSPRQTAAGQGFVDTVVRCLDDAGLDPPQLTLEITETSLLEDRSASIPALERLRELGIRISIDDFGTGQSSLARLRSLPVDELKIDRSFVAEIVSDPAGSPILTAIVTMARSLGLDLVAEGIEDEEQLHAIAGLGFQHAQGYFFSRPLPAEEIEWLVTGSQPFHSPPAGSSGNSEQQTLATAMQAILDGASDTSSAIRPLLAVLQSSTGYDAAYITTIDWQAGTQQIRYLYDTGISVISEGSIVPLEESVCRPMLAGGPWATDDVARDYPTAGAALAAGIGSYCGVPIYGPAGEIVGTLCIAGKSSVRPPARTHQLMTALSDVLADHLTSAPDVRKHRSLAH